ncbi:hypothetical protein [Streptomyces sp. NPDC101178]|uniref:hypothetical protein n=1 Tax=Streptomyces sp. NPDC101178 TaxID=3366124 RepID=UPI0037FC15BD
MPRAAETRDGRSARDPGAGAAVAAVRSLVFAAAGTALALCAHHLSSGHGVPGWSVPLAAGALFLLALPVARWPAARRGRALPVVLAATGAGQAVLHQLFAAVQSGTASAPPGTHPHGSGPGVHQAWHADHHLAVVMTAAHTVAALLVGWCMQRADASCRTAARQLGRTLDRWLGRRPAPAGPFPGRRPRTGPVRAWSRPSPYNRTILNHMVVRRGPPATR